MQYIPIGAKDFPVFHRLLSAYYREGEDADTPQEQLDGFIRYLFDLCVSGRIRGIIVYDPEPAGFVLWNIDSRDGVFSNKPGYGTILEIGVKESVRGSAVGRRLVSYAESQMGTRRYYVCAYGPAEHFWKKCGYFDSGELAQNGLKLMVKE